MDRWHKIKTAERSRIPGVRTQLKKPYLIGNRWVKGNDGKKKPSSHLNKIMTFLKSILRNCWTSLKRDKKIRDSNPYIRHLNCWNAQTNSMHHSFFIYSQKNAQFETPFINGELNGLENRMEEMLEQKLFSEKSNEISISFFFGRTRILVIFDFLQLFLHITHYSSIET